MSRFLSRLDGAIRRLATYRAVPLFGAAYGGATEKGPSLYHIVDVEKQPFRALCGRPKPDHLMDDEFVWKDASQATCATCRARYQKESLK